MIPTSVNETSALLRNAGYIANDELATCLFLSLKLKRPLLLEGEAGVGKTEVAQTLARALGRELIRLQCYDGLDISQAAYEWNVQRQLLSIRLAERMDAASLYSDEFLIERPLLRAARFAADAAPVLLIDELDRADEPFEAYLLEFLADYQLTIPERGTIKAAAPPMVIVTSNRTREIHDAIKRRCLYHWLDYPTVERELAIVKSREPNANAALSEQVVRYIARLRREDLYKSPGVAETLDWVRALTALDAIALSPETIDSTLGVVLKYQDDVAKLRGARAADLLNEVATPLV